MRNSKEIRLTEALLLITNPFTDEFSLKFVISTGDKQGQIKEVKRCRYGAYSSKNSNSNQNQKGLKIDRKMALHKEAKTLPMHDITRISEEKQGYFSPKISHFIEINGLKIVH